ncbi:hypothetical protein M430DRAFT_32000 [Amorphotheca resinae ATCC 22711]|uniref:Uncharacterized protein n=1 Tax=Amorphotheca resinae ATCC 22711 TaxID=857342 RepID=A0A2T3BCM7_AMORE|nr:hypothetical protein M430DRAFT_32000 [Amorphotheca resinae ATCC 22711]PSS27146.1 hypothetical protein M430DRAFT_32000 [Amorphotheca resinae ATCC 22711]
MSAGPAPDNTAMHRSLGKYASALKEFASSPSNFRILHSLPSTALPTPKTLYVLDSSFNPPTLAHLSIATEALLRDTQPSPSPKRLLLLLSTQNADKAPRPASFDQRLAMMQIFASDIHSNIASQSSSAKAEEIGIDIGVTKLPYFVDKAVAISESDAYPSSIQQVHLTGFDTLIRILDPKYYPPEKKLSILDPFLEKHRLMVTYRTDDEWGAKQVQDEYLDNLAKGKREQDGGKKEWVTEGRIVMCAGKQEGEETISSTKVREAVKKDDRQRLKRLLSDGVAQYVLKEKLYLETWNKD